MLVTNPNYEFIIHEVSKASLINNTMKHFKLD